MSSILKVNQIQDIGGNTIVSSDGTGGFTNNLPAGKSGAFRNIIINGDMSIAQRGTSTASITGNGYYTVDRFETICSLGTWTQSQSTDVPTGQGFAKSLKMDCTTANASPSASNSLRVRQIIEGQNLQYLKKGTANAESVTISFWVKSNKTGTYIFEIFDADNARSISKSYTIDSASTWEKKTITFDGDTSGTLGNDNGGSFECTWWLGAGTNFTSGTLQTSWSSQNNANRAVGQVNLADNTANEWYITGVQLEAGTTASDFEFLPYDVNLQRCQRYYVQGINVSAFTPIGVGIATSTTQARVNIFSPTVMRDVSAISSNISFRGAGSILTFTPSVINYNMGTFGGIGMFGTGSSYTSNETYIVCDDAVDGNEFFIDGEL